MCATPAPAPAPPACIARVLSQRLPDVLLDLDAGQAQPIKYQRRSLPVAGKKVSRQQVRGEQAEAEQVSKRAGSTPCASPNPPSSWRARRTRPP